MKQQRPSNKIVQALIAIVAIFAIFVLGSLAIKFARETKLSEPEQGLLN